MRRKECRFPLCERRRWKKEMARVTWHCGDWGTDFYWVTLWICREHLPEALFRHG